MERNQVIGFILIFAILMLWSILSPPPVVEEANPTTYTQTESTGVDSDPAVAENPISSQYNDQTDSLQYQNEMLSTYSVFAPAISGEEQKVTLENDKVKLVFSSKGGTIDYVELKDHFKIWEEGDHEEKKSLVRLMEDNMNRFSYSLPLNGKIVKTEDLFFEVDKSNQQVTFTARGINGGLFQQSYTLKDDYTLDYNIKSENLDGILKPDGSGIMLEIDNYLDKIEKNFTFEKRYSTVYFKEKEEDSDYCSCTSDDVEDLSGKPIEWISFANQFFNTSLIAQSTPFNGTIATTQLMDDTDQNLKLTTARINIPVTGSDIDFAMQMYTGPNEYKLLKAFNNDLDEVIPFGRSIFGTINRVIIRPFFDYLSKYIGSKGIVIIVLIFIIKMLLYPLTYKMLHSQAKMGVLKPELAKMKDKYKDDMQKQQMETMKVYREYGVNPMGGCMPMVIQTPIWYALFRFFPASITFRQEPFLWATDLSSYDSVLNLPFTIPAFGSHLSLFTILWAVSTVLYTYYNMKHMDMSANPAMKYVQYLMPLMFLVFFNNYASGLTCYMLFSNLINVAQTVLTKNFVFDDEKIMAELNLKKARPKKKGGFQARLEEAMRQQQKAQEIRAAQKKKNNKE